MSFTRESVYTALEIALNALPNIKTVSRKIEDWSNIDRKKQPYVGISQAREIADTTTGTKTRWQWQLDLYLYTYTEEGAMPATALNNALDEICNAINFCHPVTGKNQLGLPGEVQYCRVDGTIETDEGALGQQAVAIIPVTILIVQQ